MTNPFDSIDARLSSIETLLLDIKHSPKQHPEQQEIGTYISVASACLLLSVTPPTIYEYIKAKRLKKYKIGSTTRLLKSEVLSIVEPE